MKILIYALKGIVILLLVLAYFLTGENVWMQEKTQRIFNWIYKS